MSLEQYNIQIRTDYKARKYRKNEKVIVVGYEFRDSEYLVGLQYYKKDQRGYILESKNAKTLCKKFNKLHLEIIAEMKKLLGEEDIDNKVFIDIPCVRAIFEDKSYKSICGLVYHTTEKLTTDFKLDRPISDLKFLRGWLMRTPKKCSKVFLEIVNRLGFYATEKSAQEIYIHVDTKEMADQIEDLVWKQYDKDLKAEAERLRDIYVVELGDNMEFIESVYVSTEQLCYIELKMDEIGFRYRYCVENITPYTKDYCKYFNINDVINSDAYFLQRDYFIEQMKKIMKF